MTDMFSPVAADPYVWPFDQRWQSGDTALLLLGFQSGIVEALDASGQVAIAARVAAECRAHGVPVFASRRSRDAGRSAIAARRATMGDTLPEPHTPGWELSPGLGLTGSEPVFDHPGDNAFYATELAGRLRGSGIRNLLIAGLPTEGLVHASQRAANDMGFECLAIADACKATTATRHDSQLRITAFGNGLFGAVAGSDAILDSLRNSEATI